MQRSIFSILALSLLLVLQSCASAEKLVETGNYDQAIAYSLKKLAGKKKKKVKYVQALELAFEQVTARDMREIDRLRSAANTNPENWDRVHRLTKAITRRQEAIQPLLPLIDKEGIKASFRFVNINGIAQESRTEAADFHYTNARDLLLEGRQGNKAAARSAFTAFEKTKEYFPANYRDRTALQAQAEELGIVYVRISMENEAPVILPAGFSRRLEQINVRDLDTRWKRYHSNPVDAINYDYEVKMRIDGLDVGPELIRDREYTETKEIEDGWEYVLDENGNVAKDTSGNDIKVPRNILVKAWILETRQYKEANVVASVEVKDLQNQQIVNIEEVAAKAIFENVAATFRGDERALSRDTRRCIGNRPLPFPDDASLLLDAADQLKPVLKEKVHRTNRLI